MTKGRTTSHHLLLVCRNLKSFTEMAYHFGKEKSLSIYFLWGKCALIELLLFCEQGRGDKKRAVLHVLWGRLRRAETRKLDSVQQVPVQCCSQLPHV